LSGGVPDADDTAGALVALRQLGEPDPETVTAAAAGVRWLLGVQNRDGGIPTFCRGWGTLPFDRSTPEITAHAMRAWSEWHPYLDGDLQQAVIVAAGRALDYLVDTQRADGALVPLWFGNEQAPGDDNPLYGTARVLRGLDASVVRDDARAGVCRRRATAWLLRAQNADGGWGGDCGIRSSIEETGVALAALGGGSATGNETIAAVQRGARWLMDATRDEHALASPLGLYFARLWYYEELYPLIFGLEGLVGAGRRRPR
jgi:squalene-hopene/tetraprenyl-beta-curcumene cyclase